MEGVSIITCTIRLNQRENILRNYSNQLFDKKELIIILNKSDLDLDEWKKAVKPFKNISVYKKPHISLGECLNLGIKKAKYPFIAKFDDDDYYAPAYLTQAVETLKNSGASVVGKMSNLTYFEESNLLAIRRPNNENKYLREIHLKLHHLGGGTLVWKKKLFPTIKFPDCRIGEDIIFQLRCLEAGYAIYSSDKYQYVSIRRADKDSHTWNAEDKVVQQECEILGYTEDFKSVCDGTVDKTAAILPGVSVITCTMRPHQIQNILENFSKQTYLLKELIVILNKDDLDLETYQKAFHGIKNVSIYKKPHMSLGSCLNFGIKKALFPFIAKFDDDDYYAPKYLSQAINALKTTNASIVGKDAITTYFEGERLLALFRPQNQDKYINHVGGGTFVFKKEVFPDVKFPGKIRGEDIIFQRRCREKGYKIYSTDGDFYVSIRRKNKQEHTWQAEDHELLRECLIIDKTEDFKTFIEQKGFKRFLKDAKRRNHTE
jgi:glycosyltransferase involved in cell wall biosynthesis